MTQCQAIQYSDQMQCAACGLAWDVGDHGPPACQPRDLKREAYNDARGALTVGQSVRVEGVGVREVAGWLQRNGLLYFRLAGCERPVLSSRCRVLRD